jgi:hypothetical protein
LSPTTTQHYVTAASGCSSADRRNAKRRLGTIKHLLTMRSPNRDRLGASPFREQADVRKNRFTRNSQP